MRILIAPQEFKGTLTAVEAANAIASAIRRVVGSAELDVAPLSDGGPGFVSALLDAAPRDVGGDDVDVDDPQAALDQLKELIAELRSRARDLTESDAWNRVVVANPLLAKRAFQRPTMTSVYQFPRT